MQRKRTKRKSVFHLSLLLKLKLDLQEKSKHSKAKGILNSFQYQTKYKSKLIKSNFISIYIIDSINIKRHKMQRTESNYDKQKEKQRYLSREDRDRQERGQHKKKKKHKDQRRSRSNDSRRQKKHKRRHSRSKSDSQRKHKKHHRDHDHKEKRDNEEIKDKRENADHKQKRDSRQKEKRQRSRSQQKQRRHRRRSIERQQKDKPSQKQEKRQEPIIDVKRRQLPKQLDEKDPYFQERRQIQRVRRNEPDKAQKLQDDLQKQIIFDAKTREYEMMKEKFRQAQKQMQEAKRQDHTILVYCLPLKAKQKDIWNFFSKATCGRIRDIRIIRDQRSGKSKGVAYVEFYTSQSVEKALTMKQRPIQVKGRQFTGLKIQHSQAQKNRAAAAAKQMKVTKQPDPYEQQREALKRQTKVQVRGLYDKLANMQESELKEIFEPFGNIDYVDIHRDPETGMCKGFAFIQYSNIQDAKKAVKQMDGMELIKGHKISVSTVSHIQKGDVSTGDDYLHSHGSKMALMNSLARDAPSYSNLQRPPISTVAFPFIIMTNLFKMQGTTPSYFQNLKKQISQQCTQFGIVQKMFIQKNNQGNIWIKYSDTASAVKAQQNLNSKYFDNRKVFCYFVTEQTWNKRVSI